MLRGDALVLKEIICREERLLLSSNGIYLLALLKQQLSGAPRRLSDTLANVRHHPELMIKLTCC